MSEHSLPEDHSRWPKNPFELLGVARNASQQDIRRAYTRLIRTYKPEQFPDQFRRIRDAYEAAKQSASFFTFQHPDNPPDSPADDQPAARRTPAKSPTGNASRPPAPRTLEQELDEAWDFAIDGDEPRAYSSLLELRQRFPNRSEPCVRLYCLLSAAPELDAHRSPGDFLVQAMQLSAGDGAIRELYRREIELNPDEALTNRFAKLLSNTTQPAVLASFARWRWSAAGRRQRLNVIGDDLPVLRARLAIDHEEIWLRLLVAAAEQLTWGTSAAHFALLDECCGEVARHDHLQLRCVDAFNRLEYLEHIAAEWQSLQSNAALPADLLGLLSRFWTRPFEELRGEMAAVVGAIVARPHAWLAKLDVIDKSAPHLVSLFGEMLDSYRNTLDVPADSRNPETLDRFVREFLNENGTLAYSTLRPLLLHFCVRELIHPDLVAQVAKIRLGVENQALHDQLVADRPLRHVFTAVYLGHF